MTHGNSRRARFAAIQSDQEAAFGAPPVGDAATDAYQVALFGEPGDAGQEPTLGGCYAAADATVAAEMPEMYLSSQAWSQFDHLMQTYLDTFELRAAAEFETWAACMKRSGYDFASPVEARGHVSTQAIIGNVSLDDGSLEALELRVATADAACQAPLREALLSLDHEVQEETFGAFAL